MPDVHEDDGITASDINIKSQKTKPPARFTEGTLIEAMANVHRFIEDTQAKKTLKENEGIGTEATRAGIIETLKNRHLLELQKKEHHFNGSWPAANQKWPRVFWLIL